MGRRRVVRRRSNKRGTSSPSRPNRRRASTEPRKIASFVTSDNRYIEVYRRGSKYFYKRPFQSNRLKPLSERDLELLRTMERTGKILVIKGKLPSVKR